MFPILLLTVGLFLSHGVAANDVLNDISAAFAAAERIDLYSLSPRIREHGQQSGFHGWPILGKKKIESTTGRHLLHRAFVEGVSRYDGTAAACFAPRHGIRLHTGAHRTDLIICFECQRVAVHDDGRSERWLLISPEVQPVFDKILLEAGVRLPDPVPFER